MATLQQVIEKAMELGANVQIINRNSLNERTVEIVAPDGMGWHGAGVKTLSESYNIFEWEEKFNALFDLLHCMKQGLYKESISASI